MGDLFGSWINVYDPFDATPLMMTLRPADCLNVRLATTLSQQ